MTKEIKKSEQDTENENDLLLACAKSHLDKPGKERILNILDRSISWKNLLLLAKHHKLLPLLCKNLYETCPKLIPEEVLSQLKDYYRKNVNENFKKLHTLVSVVKKLNENNIPVTIFKGPHLTQNFYGDIGLRTFCDLDILVDRKHFIPATQILKSSGFKNYPQTLNDKYLVKFGLLNHHISMFNDARVLVELHWEVSGHYRGLIFDQSTLSPYLQTIDFYGVEVSTFTTEFLLVYLSLHGQRHYWQKYDHICCLTEVIRQEKAINWTETREIARKFKLEEVLTMAIHLAKNLTDVNINSDIFEDDICSSFYTRAVESYLKSYFKINDQVVRNKLHRNEVIVPKTLRKIGPTYNYGHLKHILRRYFIPQLVDYEDLPLPYHVYYLYFLLKPFKRFSQQFASKPHVRADHH